MVNKMISWQTGPIKWLTLESGLSSSSERKFQRMHFPVRAGHNLHSQALLEYTWKRKQTKQWPGGTEAALHLVLKIANLHANQKSMNHMKSYDILQPQFLISIVKCSSSYMPKSDTWPFRSMRSAVLIALSTDIVILKGVTPCRTKLFTMTHWFHFQGIPQGKCINFPQ
jgi:hypothetical protein